MLTALRATALLGALAIVLAGCSTQPLMASQPSGTASAPSMLPSSTAGNPPATTSLPHVVVRSWTCLMCIYSLGTMVLDDGLVLTDARDDGAMRARHLTPEGLAWVQERIAASPLAAGPASYGAVPAPGAPPDLREHTPHHFVIERDGVPVRVMSDEVDELAGGPGNWQIPDEMLALDQLSDDLADVDGWVPAGFWSDAWAPYRPERYLLFVEPERDTSTEVAPDVPDADAVPWPVIGRIDQVGTTRPGGDPQGERCLVIGPAEFVRLAAAEASRGVERPADVPYVTNVYRWARGSGELVVGTRWLLPHEPSDCRVGDGDW